MKQKHYVQRMRTRMRRNYCFANVLGADKKAVLSIVFVARVCEAHFLDFFISRVVPDRVRRLFFVQVHGLHPVYLPGK